MKKEIEKIGAIPTISIRYGKEPGISGLWTSICKIEDEKERNAEVDKLVCRMIENRDENGFWGPDDVVVINNAGLKFKLDDMTIYYDFFSTLHKQFHANQKMSPSFFGGSIKTTLTNYFGKISGDERKRASLTSFDIDENDNIIIPSIKKLKGQDCAACVEYASLSHNLWLFSGAESFYILNLNIEHAFNIVGFSKQYMLFDIVQDKFKTLDGNPIEKIEKQEELVIDGFAYSKQNKYGMGKV